MPDRALSERVAPSSSVHAAPPEARRPVFAEDLAVGDTLELGEYLVTEEEIISFASRWDPQYFHIDPERAVRDGPLGLIASGLHTMCIGVQ